LAFSFEELLVDEDDEEIGLLEELAEEFELEALWEELVAELADELTEEFVDELAEELVDESAEELVAKLV
jgi:uncharacterized protein YaaW (UPF0174 family)